MGHTVIQSEGSGATFMLGRIILLATLEFALMAAQPAGHVQAVSQGDAAVRQVIEPKSQRMSPREDTDRLLNAMMPLAEKMLSKYGEFFPFGGALRPDGSIVSVGAYDGREQPPSADVLKNLYALLRKDAQQGHVDATAVVYDVRLSDPQLNERDAVVISLDHRGGVSANVVFPYIVQRGVVQFGDPIRQVNDDRIFSPQ